MPRHAGAGAPRDWSHTRYNDVASHVERTHLVIHLTQGLRDSATARSRTDPTEPLSSAEQSNDPHKTTPWRALQPTRRAPRRPAPYWTTSSQKPRITHRPYGPSQHLVCQDLISTTSSVRRTKTQGELLLSSSPCKTPTPQQRTNSPCSCAWCRPALRREHKSTPARNPTHCKLTWPWRRRRPFRAARCSPVPSARALRRGCPGSRC